MIKVCIIGSGNVAQHLISAFASTAEIKIVQVFARNRESLSHLIDSNKVTSDLNALEAADIYFIAVSDDAIASVSQQLPFKDKLVVHTSGSVPMLSLDDKNSKGVFYPLQTFSKNKAVDFSEIPICIESENPADFKTLEKAARSISQKTFSIDSQQRKALHVSAVFVNNFVNHLYQIGNDICNENGISFEILKPLIRETAEKIMTLSPAEAQTGPAKRHDERTIAAHLQYLTNENQHHLYQLLTQSIQTHE